MILVLLDHPWPLEAALDGSSPGFQVLLNFEELVRDYGLEPVPFIGQSEYDQLWQRIDQRHCRSSGWAALRRLAPSLVRRTNSHCRAVPHPGPADLSEDWKRALREAVVPSDWRNPQVIVAGVRKTDWPATGDEIEIRFDPCDNQPDLPPERRVLAMLDSFEYERHPFVRSDFDPWDLQRAHPPPPNAAQHMRHPCCLPKPPMKRAALEDLELELADARRRAWGSGGKYYFVPGENWKHESVPKQAWRQGRSFLYRKCQGSNRNGYVDFEGREWVWDQNERHWDVQTMPYRKISHTGDLLP